MATHSSEAEQSQGPETGSSCAQATLPPVQALRRTLQGQQARKEVGEL